MGNDDRSGPIKWLRLDTRTDNCDGGRCPRFADTQAASLPIGASHCFYVEMGLKGGLAQDQDEPPIAFNITGHLEPEGARRLRPRHQHESHDEIENGVPVPCRTP